MQRLRLIRHLEERTRDGHRMAMFACTCGNEKAVAVSRVRNGYTTSCGCQRPGNRTHGMRYTPEYRSWQAMVGRCSNPAHKDYPRYGAKGIHVCDEWRRSFSAFVAHIGPRPEGTSIDRIDPGRGYTPGNVRWATPHEQSRNRQDLTLVSTPLGTMALVDYAARIGITKGAAHLRLKRNKLEGVQRV
jgi:hypothetical protein